MQRGCRHAESEHHRGELCKAAQQEGRHRLPTRRASLAPLQPEVQNEGRMREFWLSARCCGFRFPMRPSS